MKDIEATISQAEAAKLIGVSEITLFRQRKAGTLPFVKIGKTVRYRRKTIDEWLAKNERNSSTTAAETRNFYERMGGDEARRTERDRCADAVEVFARRLKIRGRNVVPSDLFKLAHSIRAGRGGEEII